MWSQGYALTPQSPKIYKFPQKLKLSLQVNFQWPGLNLPLGEVDKIPLTAGGDIAAGSDEADGGAVLLNKRS